MRYFLLASAAAALAVGGPGMAQTRPGGGPPGQGGPGGQGGYQGGHAPATPAPSPTPAAPPVAVPSRPTGSFQASCRNIQVDGASVTAECRNIHSRYPISTINFTACRGDLSNNNGVLTCPGATASVPPGQDDGSGGRRGNNDGQIAGAVLGALAGAGNAGSPPPPGPPPPPPGYQPGYAYPPGYDYPAYGDQRYGDPRYDPRYGAQGWGYGRRPGEWVSIRERADWLSQRIDHELEDGDLSRREARELRRDVADLEDQEDRYRRQGMAPWMREDLDRRFDALAERVHQDPPRHDDHRDGPPPGYYGR